MASNAEKIVDKLREMFGDHIADPDVFPKQFEYQVKMARYELQLESEKVNDNSTGQERDSSVSNS